MWRLVSLVRVREGSRTNLLFSRRYVYPQNGIISDLVQWYLIFFIFCCSKGSTREVLVDDETDLQWRLLRKRNFVVRGGSMRAEPFDELDCRGAEPMKTS